MLIKITEVAQILAEFNVRNVEMTMDSLQVDSLKMSIKSQFGMYGIEPPYEPDIKDLDISIMGIKFLIKKTENKFKLNPMLTNFDNNGLRELQARIQKSYWERENQIADAFVRGKEDLIEWASKKKSLGEMSHRLYNSMIKTKPLYGLTLDELTWKEWFKYRGCGKITWNEFVKLRGY
jgi:hypothetical protein